MSESPLPLSVIPSTHQPSISVKCEVPVEYAKSEASLWDTGAHGDLVAKPLWHRQQRLPEGSRERRPIVLSGTPCPSNRVDFVPVTGSDLVGSHLILVIGI